MAPKQHPEKSPAYPYHKQAGPQEDPLCWDQQKNSPEGCRPFRTHSQPPMSH